MSFFNRQFAVYQQYKKEVLPLAVTPPFLLCKDNTFLSGMQIASNWWARGERANEVKICDKRGCAF